MNDKGSIAKDSEDTNKNSYLELEETIIPYPDSFDIMKNNENDYILRIEHPFEYEKLVLKCRMSIYDNENYSNIKERYLELESWFHSTVYNYNDDILDDENQLIIDTSIISSGFIFDMLNKNMEMIREQLFYNDILIIKNNKVYRYILSRNMLLYRGICSNKMIENNIITADELTDMSSELLIILSHPKRGSIIFGERSYQKSLINAGELAQIIMSLASSKQDVIRMRKQTEVYDFEMLSNIGIEDNNSIITSIYEVHETNAK